MKINNYKKYIHDNIIRERISARVGGVEIDASHYFGDDAKISAYQNYLGGGLKGCICSDYNFKELELSDEQELILKDITKAIKLYYFERTTDGNKKEYQEIQARPESAY